MKKYFNLSNVVFFYLLVSSPFFVLAQESKTSGTLSADLLGSGKLDVLNVTDVYNAESGLNLFKVSFGKSEITQSYHVPDDDKPTVQVLKIDELKERNLLLISTVMAGGCNYEVYSYRVELGFSNIFSKFSVHCDFKPEVLNSGVIVYGEWHGFWMQINRYIYESKSDSFQKVEEELFSVGVTVKTNIPIYGFSTGNFSKQLFVVGVDEQLEIIAFNESSGMYLVRNKNQILAWVSRKVVEKIKSLPWAG